MSTRCAFAAASFVCTKCGKACKSPGGLKRHRNAHLTLPSNSARPPANTTNDNPPEGNFDPPPSPGPDPPPSPPPQPTCISGTPYDTDRYDLPRGAISPPWEDRAPDDDSPFESRSEFEFAEFLYVQEEMSGAQIDRLAQLLTGLYDGVDPPFADHQDLYATIDAIQQGDIPWQSFSVKYTGPIPEGGTVPVWMTETFEVWFRSPLGIFEKQLANPDFEGEMDWAPNRIFKNRKRQFVDLFSGNWVWEQADKIAADPACHGALFVPGVFGSYKTTVSVGTGNTEFYPLYSGIGNVHNVVRRTHHEVLSVMTFLSIPKTTRQFAKSKEFRKFRRQLFHVSIARILQPLKPHTKKPHVTRCANGHFRRVIYGLGPYIADYPEQVLLTCIVDTLIDVLSTKAQRRRQELK
ncbi:hypothetical protein R3P38DRAFT_2562260 [Favolaschia claudopus]|uniref:C2H2-type domain-containing protein n=1 Tax=Favolaschia claudopus TaxID=2862362 RepID=A0AAW0A1N1_9AGAR